jgi:hypothetical protein
MKLTRRLPHFGQTSTWRRFGDIAGWSAPMHVASAAKSSGL